MPTTLALLIACSSVGAANNEPATLLKRANAAGRTTFLSARHAEVIPNRLDPSRPIITPDDFLDQYGLLFGIENAQRQLIREGTQTDAIGHAHTTYRQAHEGVPVFSGTLRVHQNATGAVIAANGDVYPISRKLSTTPDIDATMAVGLAIEEVGGPAVDVEETQLVVVDPGWYGDPSRGARLAYHVVLIGNAWPLRETLFIDAHTGATLDRWSLVYDARERAIHDARAGSDCCFDHEGTGCDSEACEMAVCDARPGCCEDPWLPICAAWAAYACDTLCLPGTLSRAEGEGPTGVADVDAAYNYAGDTYDYFQRAFGRDGIDGKGGPITVTAHSQAIGCPNAFWSGERLAMAFCEGVVSDDIVAHEMVHGITQFTAELIYQNQPGQLNESFSDVFGELVDLFNGDAAFLDGTGGPAWPMHETGPGTDWPNDRRTGCSDADDGYPNGVRWMSGEDAIAFGGAIRDMWDPTCEGDPDRGHSPLQTCDIFDAGGVHSGSGIPNHAFALLVDGGVFNRREVRGIGPIKAGAVWYRALTTYLTIASDFEDAFAALNQAAVDLVGSHPNDPRTGLPSSDPFTLDDATSVARALLAVEMDTRGRCGETVTVLDSTPRRICGNARVIFEDDFEGGGGAWRAYHESPASLPTPYDWVVISESLPFDRAGSVWFCENLDAGDCQEEDETAVHYLVSPPIALPTDANFPYLAFTHYLATEGGWDGGTLGLRLNEGAWRAVPRSSFEFNPFNSVLVGTGTRSINPLADRDAWTGLGGRWGTSILDLGGLAEAGDSIEVRFEFGKDGCGGVDGWYVDDFLVYDCPDCNLNGRPDQQDFTFTFTSEVRKRIGVGASQRFVIERPLPAASDVRLVFDAMGDFSTEGEAVAVYFNGQFLDAVFSIGAADCPLTTNRDELVVPAAGFNIATAESDAVFELVASEWVNPELCFGQSLLMATISYELAASDIDDDGIPDECQNCAISDAPEKEPTTAGQSRYLSVLPGNPGRQTALRVCAVDLPPPLSNKIGTCQWASRPRAVSTHAGQSDAIAPTTTMARLSCQPDYADWGQHGVVHLFGELLVPGGVYEVRSIDLACGVAAEGFYSAELAIESDQWADVAGPCQAGICPVPDGIVDITDLMAMVAAYEGGPDGVDKSVTDLGPGLPDQVVDVVDIVLAIDAFGGESYPYTSFRLPCERN